eukprot:983848-Rhodomonas_salina.1
MAAAGEELQQVPYAPAMRSPLSSYALALRSPVLTSPFYSHSTRDVVFGAETARATSRAQGSGGGS